MNARNAFWGLLRHRTCLVPTWRGLILLALFVFALLTTTVLNLYPFLAISDPVPAEVLVVEGWAPDYVLDEARVEFERHPYRRLYVTGGPLEIGGHLSQYKTYAELGAATLVEMGLRKGAVEAVPAPAVRRDRTYSSAIALKTRLQQQGSHETAINLVSEGAHARRSQLLFQKALGKELRVGIIAVQDRGYDPRRWWKFSEGVRNVIDELIAYLYAVVVFSPPLPEPCHPGIRAAKLRDPVRSVSAHGADSISSLDSGGRRNDGCRVGRYDDNFYPVFTRPVAPE